MDDKKILLAYFGHHKCATTWINSIIHLVCYDLNLEFAHVHNAEMFNNKLDIFVKNNKIDFLSYTGADIRHVKDIGKFLGFHVIRDPRDIIVSAYFSHLHSHPTKGWPALVEHRKSLKKASQEDGLFLVMEFMKHDFERLYKWDYSQKNVLEIKMEDIISSPYESMVKAFSHMNVVVDTPSVERTIIQPPNQASSDIDPKSRNLVHYFSSINKVPVEVLLGYVFHNRFSRITKGRKQGEEDITKHYRKGVAGDWINHFNQEHRRYFKDNYNDLLVKLGYEKTSDW